MNVQFKMNLFRYPSFTSPPAVSIGIAVNKPHQLFGDVNSRDGCPTSHVKYLHMDRRPFNPLEIEQVLDVRHERGVWPLFPNETLQCFNASTPICYVGTWNLPCSRRTSINSITLIGTPSNGGDFARNVAIQELLVEKFVCWNGVDTHCASRMKYVIQFHSSRLENLFGSK